MEIPTVSGCVEEWTALTNEFRLLENTHKRYIQKLEELEEIQRSCLKDIAHQKYCKKQIKASLKKAKRAALGYYGHHDEFGKNLSDEDKQKVYKLEKEMLKHDEQIREFEEYLPRKNGLYLRIILGNVNVSLMNKADQFGYKDEYEKFKLIVTGIGVVLSFLNLTVLNYRFMDLAFMFLLVWYYCTLTIRESILKVNGSRIKGWWRTHHFISTAVSGILLIWPDTPTYYMFRKQFMLFNCYIGLVQYLQFRYQQGCLYRLKSLGERHNMDITIEGFHSWMWRGLSFLLPFLYGGYLFQLYNAYVLYQLNFLEECTEWQVPVLSASFFLLFLGNSITTSLVIPQKLREKLPLKYRFPRFSKKDKQIKNKILNDIKEVDEREKVIDDQSNSSPELLMSNCTENPKKDA